MKKTIGLICTILLLTGSSAFASAKVANIQLSWQDGFTVARVEVQGAVRFSHQTEEAKDGRPFRVIVDILSATHNLGQKSFGDLPSCPVTRIRTSQYAVSPEKVVRLVFDMRQETVYRVDSDDQSVSIYFPDKAGTAFAAWSSSDVVAGNQPAPEEPEYAHVSEGPSDAPAAPSHKTAAALNQSITDDRLASLQSEQPAPSRPTVEKPDITPTAPKPEIDNTPPVVAAAPSMTTAEPTAKTAPTPKASASTPTPTHAQAKPSTASTPAPSQPKSEPKPTVVSNPAPAPSHTLASAEPKAEPKASPTVKPTPTPSPEPEVATEEISDEPTPDPASATEQTQDDARPTSRFRRSPTRPADIKGTLVAEFPKRLVIKYSSGNRRDPFATLIDETKQYNSPIERRIPNVEGLRLVGIIEAETGNSALFEDKDGYGYILKEGDKVQKGYVLRVRADRVYFQIFEYGWSRTVALNLDKD